MTREAFLADRQRIVDALQRASIAEIRFHKDDLPKVFPCAVVVLETEDGLLPTGRQYLESRLGWTIYLVVDAFQKLDPDSDLYTLKEDFRDKYIKLLGRDFAHIDYYSARVDGTRTVRIAKLTTAKGGSA
jgi:hypothetical protein